jgi:hypothetical protein
MKKIFGIILIVVGIFTLPKVFSTNGFASVGGLVGVGLITFLPAYFLLKKGKNDEGK